MQPRFIIYLFAVNALMNGIGFVPRILLTGRHDGAYAALLGAFLLNLFIILFIFRLLRRFPQKDLSSILAETIPPLLRVPLMIYFVLQWLIAGSLSVIMVAEISAKYLNVGASGLTILYLFIILVLTAARLRSDRVLFALELSFIMTLPLLFLIVIATFTTQGILWKSIVILLGEGGLPDWEQLSAASYVYIGYINILLFNKVIQSTFRLWKLIIGIMVIFILYLFLFSLPIALLGTEAVAHYHYPWVITADSLRIEHAPIERAFYPALIGYLNIALLNTIVHWHVTLEFLKSLRPASGQARSTQTTGAKEKSAQSTDAKQKPAQGGGMPLLPKKENLWQSLMMRLEFWVLAAYGLTLLPFVYNRLPIDLFYELNRWWLRFLLPNELLALLLLVWSAWRTSGSAQQKQKRSRRKRHTRTA
ncbi:MAG: GerAB/ArcD/ProY family transporter [Candidatus Carbobacillus altaicus]|nr:GerAB/ArcD/ProY family transporter [Candidatus Carbobacillus altaicus]